MKHELLFPMCDISRIHQKNSHDCDNAIVDVMREHNLSASTKSSHLSCCNNQCKLVVVLSKLCNDELR